MCLFTVPQLASPISLLQGFSLACLMWLAAGISIVIPTSNHPSVPYSSNNRPIHQEALFTYIHVTHLRCRFGCRPVCPSQKSPAVCNQPPRTSSVLHQSESTTSQSAPWSPICRKNGQRQAASLVANGASSVTRLNRNANDASRPMSIAKATPPRSYCVPMFPKRCSKGGCPATLPVLLM